MFFLTIGLHLAILIMRRMKLFSCYLACLIFHFTSPTQGQEVNTLPIFSFSDIEGKEISDNGFRNDRQLIVFYYEPTCSHCQLQAEWVASKIDDFSGVDLLWVAWQPTVDISDFRSQFFPQEKNVYYAIDDKEVFDELFGFSQIPTIFLYDAQNKLIKKFKRETKSEKLLKTLGIAE